jgi:cysteine synthase
VKVPGISTLWTAVGNTPLLNVTSLSKRTGCAILGKAEFMNPGGSVKDRAAKGIIESAEKNGLLKIGDTIVEGTAGNTGIGLALLAKERGYKVVVTMPDNQSQEKYDLLEILGATVIKVPVVPFTNENHFFHKAQQLAKEHHWYWANQFENLANCDVHYQTTGKEIVAQCNGHLDFFVTSAGTGGTIAGVSRAIKEAIPSCKVILSDPLGSGLFSYFHSGALAATGTSITEGIGIMRVTDNFRKAMLDDAMQMSDERMISMLYHVAKEDGLVIGTSAALNVASAYEIALKNPGARIATMLCDHGSRYASKIFSADFLASKQMVVKPLNDVFGL